MWVGGKAAEKRYDHLLRIRSIFYIILLTAFPLSLSLSLSMYLCGNKEGEAVNRWGDEGKRQQRDCVMAWLGGAYDTRQEEKEVPAEAGG